MADRTTSQDRRRWRRHWLRAPVRIVSQEHPIDGFGLRVSEGGIFLFAVADIAPGALVEVEFTKPHSGERSRRWGVVRNRVVYLYGLEFVRDEQPEWVECSAEAART